MSTEHARELAEQLGVDWNEAVAVVAWRGAGIVYRLVRQDPPRRRDFVSTYEKGAPPMDTPDPFVLFAGISVTDDEGAARSRAVPPTYLAEVHLGEGLGIYVAKTFGPHHYTLWGQPDILMAASRVVDHLQKP